MRRALCIWLPNWPIQRLCDERAALKTRPLVLYAPHPRRGEEVVACCPRAAACGIVPGMPVAEAGSRGAERAHDAARFLEHDPWGDRAALERLADWCHELGPTVAVEEAERPESLLLDTTGLAHLFGGGRAHAEHVVHAFHRRGLLVRVAAADTPGAAWAVAHFGLSGQSDRPALRLVPRGGAARALAPLPVAALRLPEATIELLRELGIERVGDVARLPRESLAPRFGPLLLKRLDQALGRQQEVIAPRHPQPPAAADWTFESPTDRLDALEHACRRLLEQVVAALGQGRGVQRLHCAIRGPGRPLELPVGLFRPCASVAHLWELLRLQLESARLDGPVAAVQIEVSSAGLLPQQQQLLFESGRQQERRELSALIDRLSARLGRQRVVQARLLAEAQPEYAYRYRALLNGGSSGGARKPRRAAVALWERPLRLAARPLPLEVVSLAPAGPPVRFRIRGRSGAVEHRVARTRGPQRVATRWWRGGMVRRDYYRAETETGHWYWLFRRRQDGAWFLHGWFD